MRLDKATLIGVIGASGTGSAWHTISFSMERAEVKGGILVLVVYVVLEGVQLCLLKG